VGDVLKELKSKNVNYSDSKKSKKQKDDDNSRSNSKNNAKKMLKEVKASI
jgi:hypothetical protein